MIIVIICFHNVLVSGQINKTLFNPDSLKSDVEFFFKTITDVHPNIYAYNSKQVVDEKKQYLLKAIDHPMSLFDFWLLFCPVANSLFDGHTGIDDYNVLFEEFRKCDNFPRNIVNIKDNKLYFIKGFKLDGKDLSDREIVSINNYYSSVIIEKIASFFSCESKDVKSLFVEENIHVLFPIVFGKSEEYVFRCICKEGDPDTVMLSKSNGINEYFQDFNEVEFEVLSQHKSALLTLNSFNISKDKSDEYYQKINNAFDSIIKSNIKYLFIDISRNGGGNSNYAIKILDRIISKKIKISDGSVTLKTSPQIKQKYTDYFYNGKVPNFFKILINKSNRAIYWKRNGKLTTFNSSFSIVPVNPYKGKIYLIQGRATFSASVDLSSIVKYYKLATIIGEETGGLTAGYIDSYSFKLPYSGLSCKCSHKSFCEIGGKPDGHGVLPNIYYQLNYRKKTDIEELIKIINHNNLNN